MASTPIFPMPEPQHYSDYGFDPQLDYFQVLEEARRHGGKRTAEPRPIDAIHFKLQKPISKDNGRAHKKRKQHWWKSAIHLFSWKRGGAGGDDKSSRHAQPQDPFAYTYRPVSGPVYATESGFGGSSTPCRTSRPTSGPLAAAEVGVEGMPYVCLRDLNFTGGHRISASGPPPMPIYLVT